MERKILVLLFSFLCVFILIALILIVLFPSINPVYLAIIPLVISIFLTYVLIKMSKEPSSILLSSNSASFSLIGFSRMDFFMSSNRIAKSWKKKKKPEIMKQPI